MQRILDSIVGAPAFVRNERLDVLAANRLGEAFYAPLYDGTARPVNSARFVFLNPKAPEFFVDWDTIANDTVGILRGEAGRDPYDKAYPTSSASSPPGARSFASSGQLTT